MSDNRKPYEVELPFLMYGDPIGWMDNDGSVHVETFKSRRTEGGSDVYEVEPRPDPVPAGLAALCFVNDAMRAVKP